MASPSVLRFAAMFGSATILGQLGQLAWLGAASRALSARRTDRGARTHRLVGLADRADRRERRVVERVEHRCVSRGARPGPRLTRGPAARSQLAPARVGLAQSLAHAARGPIGKCCCAGISSRSGRRFLIRVRWFDSGRGHTSGCGMRCEASVVSRFIASGSSSAFSAWRCPLRPTTPRQRGEISARGRSLLRPLPGLFDCRFF